MEKEQVFSAILNNDNIPTFPHTLSRVLSILDDNSSSAENIASVIKKDVSLTAKLLRMANSPFYGRSQGIATISSAVVLLGTRAVQAMALSVSIYGLFKTKDSPEFNPKQFWRHSLEVAILCKALAEKLNYHVTEEAFVCGLLHDVGILLLNRIFPDEYAKVLKRHEQGQAIHRAEEEVFKCNHADIMGSLGEKWNLPDRVVKAVNCHHRPMADPGGESELLTSVLQASEGLSKFYFDLPPAGAGKDMAAFERIQGNLGISENELIALTRPVMDEVVNTAQFLDIDIGSPMELLSSANEMLYGLFYSVDNILREQAILQERLIYEEKRKAAIKSLRITIATFSHYVNNATASILGRTQLLGLALKRGEVVDKLGKTQNTIKVIQDSVENISAVLEELKILEDFDTIPYSENSTIFDIEQKVRRRLKELEIPGR